MSNFLNTKRIQRLYQCFLKEDIKEIPSSFHSSFSYFLDFCNRIGRPQKINSGTKLYNYRNIKDYKIQLDPDIKDFYEMTFEDDA